MGYIKKKQVLGLLEDLSILQYGTPTLKRTTRFAGTPLEGDAILNSTEALNITTLKINTRDSFLGNSYSQLNDISEGDNLVIKDPNSENLAIYSINDINTDEVDSSYEGYFILTIQHSFGYNSTFNQGELIYYFRRVPSSSIFDLIEDEESRAMASESNLNTLITTLSLSIDNVNELIEDETARAIGAEKTLEGLMLSLIQSTSTSSSLNKYTETINFNVASKTINHNLNNTDVIVQLINTSTGESANATFSSFTENSVNIQVESLTTYKVIIIG